MDIDKQEKRAFLQKQTKKSKVLKTLKEEFWTEGISFYFDGVGFVHKTIPHDEARSSGARNWRKSGEGLIHTAKGKKKEGSSGKTANFFCCNCF